VPLPRLSDVRVGRRLGLAFGAVGTLVVVCAGTGLSAVGEQRDLAAELSGADAVLAYAETARFQIADVTGWQGLVVADATTFGPAAALDPDAYNRSGLLDAKDGVYAWLDDVDTAAMDADEAAAFAELRPAWDNYFTWDDQVVAWLTQGTPQGYRTALESINGGEAGEGYGIVLDVAERIQASAAERADALRQEQEEAQERATFLLTAVGLLALVLAVLCAVLVGRSIVRPLRQVQGVAGRLAADDLTARTGVDRQDKVGQLAQALDAAQDRLASVMASVVASADAVAASSEELSASSAQISASAEETSAQSGVVAGAAEEVSRSVQTVAAGAEQMGASIREIASNAAEASAVAAQAVTASCATSLASAALVAISRIEAPICSAPAATVRTLSDTSPAAPATTPDCALVS